MGGLRKYMPITAGHVHRRLAGHRRHPAVLGLLVEGRDPRLRARRRTRALYVVGLFAALLTAFYMTRQVFLVFFGDAKWRLSADDDRGGGASAVAADADARQMLDAAHRPARSSTADGRPRAPTRVRAARVAVDDDAAARRARLPLGRRRLAQPAVRQPRLPRALARAGVRGSSDQAQLDAQRRRRSCWLAGPPSAIVALRRGIAVACAHLPRSAGRRSSSPSTSCARPGTSTQRRRALVGGPGAAGRRRCRHGSTARSSTAPSTASARVSRVAPPLAACACRPATCAATPSAWSASARCCSLGFVVTRARLHDERPRAGRPKARHRRVPDPAPRSSCCRSSARCSSPCSRGHGPSWPGSSAVAHRRHHRRAGVYMLVAVRRRTTRASSSSSATTWIAVARHQVRARRRRHLAVPGRAHRRPVPARAARGEARPRREGATTRWILLLEAGCLGRVPRARPVPVLRDLRAHARADVLPHRRWGHGRRVYAAIKFFLYTLFGSAFMLVSIVVARRSCTRPGDGGTRHLRPPARSPTAAADRADDRRGGSSSASPSPSRSRRRCSRSTPGCPTRTPRRRPPGSVILAGVAAQARHLRLPALRRSTCSREASV